MTCQLIFDGFLCCQRIFSWSILGHIIRYGWGTMLVKSGSMVKCVSALSAAKCYLYCSLSTYELIFVFVFVCLVPIYSQLEKLTLRTYLFLNIKPCDLIGFHKFEEPKMVHYITINGFISCLQNHFCFFTKQYKGAI